MFLCQLKITGNGNSQGFRVTKQLNTILGLSAGDEVVFSLPKEPISGIVTWLIGKKDRQYKGETVIMSTKVNLRNQSKDIFVNLPTQIMALYEPYFKGDKDKPINVYLLETTTPRIYFMPADQVVNENKEYRDLRKKAKANKDRGVY